MNQLLIRADAFPRIGTGHIMRCIAVAQSWRARGGKVTFISHCESESLRHRIAAEGFEILPVEHPHPEALDLERTLKILNRHEPGALVSATGSSLIDSPWLVLDGYHFTPDYQKAIRDTGVNLLVIDDINHLPYYHADILLNQNIHAPNLPYHCDPDATLLLGTPYVLLRHEFLKYNDFKRDIPEKAKKILITMGGSDPDNVTLKVIEAIKLAGDPTLEVKIIIGPSNPNAETVKAAVLNAPCSMRCIGNATHMPELMTWADLAITAGGSTCWELAFMGLASLIVVLADNQIPVATGLGTAGVALNLGKVGTKSVGEITQQTERLISDFNFRSIASKRGKELVDGKGCIRVLAQIESFGISLRHAEMEDCRLVWEWANDPITRAASFSPDPIAWVNHVEWFERMISDLNTVFYICTNREGEPFAQIRYHISEDEALVSVSLKPEARGKGLGSHVIRLASDDLFKRHDIDVIKAYIKPDNYVSKHAFEKAGFNNDGPETIENQSANCFILKQGPDK